MQELRNIIGEALQSEPLTGEPKPDKRHAPDAPPSELAQQIIAAINADRRYYTSNAAMNEAHARLVDQVLARRK